MGRPRRDKPAKQLSFFLNEDLYDDLLSYCEASESTVTEALNVAVEAFVGNQYPVKNYSI